MKQFLILIVSALFLTASCNKDGADPGDCSDTGNEIIFGINSDGIGIDSDTKATAVTSLSSLYWECRNGSSVVYPVSSYTVSGNKVNTGKYWPSGEAVFNYTVSNVSFTTSTGFISATNSTDIVVGQCFGITSDNDACTVTLNHIFARTGTLTFNTQDGYSLSNVSWRIKSKGANTGVSGTYTIGTGWGATATASLTEQTFTSSSDLYLIPGEYTVTVNYTLSKGTYVESFSKSADVTLVQGRCNSITGTATGGSAVEISFSVNVTPWDTNNIDANFF